MRLTELFNSRVDRHLVTSTPNRTVMKAKIGDREIVFMAHLSGESDTKIATIEFYEKDSKDTSKDLPAVSSRYDKTGSGSELQVFGFVIDCVKDMIIDFEPVEIDFTVVKADKNRAKLYRKLASRIPGYKLKSIEDGSFEELYTFVKT